MKKIAIGLPVYNGANFLAAAIDSILAQSYADFELVISDNASTDNTEEICRAYAQRDRRVRYVRQPTNVGAANNHNLLVRMSDSTDRRGRDAPPLLRGKGRHDRPLRRVLACDAGKE